MNKKTILDNNNKDENLKKIMSMPKGQRILSLYDNINNLSYDNNVKEELRLKGKIYICDTKDIAGEYAYNNESWCFLYINNKMSRHKIDSIAPINQHKFIYDLRALAQYIIDTLRETDVYLYSTDTNFIEKLKKIPIIKFDTISKSKLNNKFDFELFKKPTNLISRLDFVLNNSGNYYSKEEMANIREYRELRFIFLDDGLYILDKKDGIVFSCIATNINILNKNEKKELLEHEFFLSGRCYQGDINNFPKYIGVAFLPNSLLKVINKLNIIKVNYFNKNILCDIKNRYDL